MGVSLCNSFPDVGDALLVAALSAELHGRLRDLRDPVQQQRPDLPLRPAANQSSVL